MPFEERLVGYWARHGMEVSFLGVLRERKFVPTMMGLRGHDKSALVSSPDNAVIRVELLLPLTDGSKRINTKAERNAYTRLSQLSSWLTVCGV
jgi:hypothetical protein